MKKIILSLLLILPVMIISARGEKNKSAVTLVPAVHRIVFQLTTGDTSVHKTLMKQLNNITSVAPATQIEVVCHGPGLDMLVTEKVSFMKKSNS